MRREGRDRRGAADRPWDEGRAGSGYPGEGRNGSAATLGKLERRGLGPPSAFMPELPLLLAVQVPLLRKKNIKKREGRHGLNEARAGEPLRFLVGVGNGSRRVGSGHGEGDCWSEA